MLRLIDDVARYLQLGNRIFEGLFRVEVDLIKRCASLVCRVRIPILGGDEYLIKRIFFKGTSCWN